MLMLQSHAAWAQDLSCMAAATEKKLAGAAKNSFLKMCEKDATARCDLGAQEKKLASAAKKSFIKKMHQGCRRQLIHLIVLRPSTRDLQS